MMRMELVRMIRDGVQYDLELRTLLWFVAEFVSRI